MSDMSTRGLLFQWESEHSEKVWTESEHYWKFWKMWTESEHYWKFWKSVNRVWTDSQQSLNRFSTVWTFCSQLLDIIKNVDTAVISQRWESVKTFQTMFRMFRIFRQYSKCSDCWESVQTLLRICSDSVHTFIDQFFVLEILNRVWTF
jgi:ABC-type dipeptide/oligopeptide/nickel transport system ATPase subunit